MSIRWFFVRTLTIRFPRRPPPACSPPVQVSDPTKSSFFFSYSLAIKEQQEQLVSLRAVNAALEERLRILEKK
jgi:hypothetical protein